MKSADRVSGQIPAGRAGEVAVLPAASVLIVRAPLEVLLLRRNDASGFVPGSWIFPGGALDPSDRTLAATFAAHDAELVAMKICAVRETLEESGVWLGNPEIDSAAVRERVEQGGWLREEEIGDAPERLIPLARWVTPAGLERRYDTWFFAAAAPAACDVRVDGREGVEARWIAPAAALEEHRAGRLKMVFPTIRNLESIARYGSVDELLSVEPPDPVPVFRPLLVEKDGRSRIVLPEEES